MHGGEPHSLSVLTQTKGLQPPGASSHSALSITLSMDTDCYGEDQGLQLTFKILMWRWPPPAGGTSVLNVVTSQHSSNTCVQTLLHSYGEGRKWKKNSIYLVNLLPVQFPHL